MEYFPENQLMKDKATVFQCNICNGYFIEGDGNVSCAVMHSPGDCCHFNDCEISEGHFDAIIELIMMEEE